MRVCTYVRAYVGTRLRICVYVCLCTYMDVYVCIYVFRYVHVWMHVLCRCMYVQVGMDVYMYSAPTPQTFNKNSPSWDEGLLMLMDTLTFWWILLCLLRVWGLEYKKSSQAYLREPNKKWLDTSCLRVSFFPRFSYWRYMVYNDFLSNGFIRGVFRPLGPPEGPYWAQWDPHWAQ